MPWIAGTAKVTLLLGDREVDAKAVSGSAPLVTVVSPNGGERVSSQTAAIEWTASDADGDSLEYEVQVQP